MKKLIFVQLLFMFINVNAQIDSIQEALKYFPLHIGDYWQYRVEKNSYGLSEPDTSWIGFKEVTGDTIMQNNKKYFIIKEDHITFPYQAFFRPRFIRIDSLTAEVFEYDIISNKENKIDSLLIKKGDKFFGYECKSDTTKEYFGVQVETKLIGQYLVSSTAYHGWELAKGLGEVMRYFDDISLYWTHYQCDLIYAEIDGSKYGIKTNIEKSGNLPNQIKLFQNYPNPFNPTTTINYSVPKQSYVTIIIYDALGREITSLVNDFKPIGNYSVEFHATNLSSGIYFYQIKVDQFIQTLKMILIR